MSFVIPTLLSYTKGSVFVTDPKGENYRLTFAHRAAMGQKIIRFDPFNVCGRGNDCFNPLDLIASDSITLIDDALALAEAMVVRPPEGDKDPYWNNSAVIVIHALIVWVLVYADENSRNLTLVREALCDPDMYNLVIDMLCSSDDELVAQLGGQLKHSPRRKKNRRA